MSQGRLRIYLGAAPGVGKTVAMLNEGHRRADRGTDVVVGVVETHGRTFTESLLEGLEIIPRKRVEYHGAVLEEMDTDAILDRQPTIVLVDELAHTNAPGSKHEKRYQDVLELLDAGINVISTVNIQHLESLNDAVTAITGIVQRETVPDEIVRAADQIDLVDMSPDALRRRMIHGHIYAPDQVNAALANYFRQGNLSALRELALLWMADKVEAGLEDYRTEHAIAGAWPVRERVVVALSGDPGGEALLRRGARIASRLAGGQFLGVYVVRPDGLTSAPVGTVAKLQDVTQQLGGEFHTIAADDPTQALLDFARGVNATQILVGTATVPWWRRAFAPSFAAQVIAAAGDIDVHVVNRPTEKDPRGRITIGRPTWRLWGGAAAALLLPVLITVILVLGDPTPSPALDVPLYMLTTVVVGLLGGEVPAVLAGVASSLLFDWFFVPPLGALAVTNPRNLVGLVAFVVVGVLVAAIVHLNALRTRQAVAAQRESAALAELSHSLLGTTEQMPLLLNRAIDMFGVKGAALLRSSSLGKPTVLETEGDFDAANPADHERVDDDHELALQPAGLPPAQRRLFAAFAVHAAAILQREALAQTAATAGQATRDSVYKTALLSVISHDLRSPLASIKTAIGHLRDEAAVWSDTDEAEFDAIETSAERLEALIGNLLQLSLLQTGDVVARPVLLNLRETLRDAVAHVGGPLKARWTVEAAARHVLADQDLLNRSLDNILRNAASRQPPRAPVTVTASRISDRVEIRVIDAGPTVPEADFDRIFAPLRQLGDAPDEEGLALALAVARGMTEAMDGSVTAEATPGGGLTVVLSLPAASEPQRQHPAGQQRQDSTKDAED